MHLLKTNLKLLVNSGIPGNSTLVNAEDAFYILESITELESLKVKLLLANEVIENLKPYSVNQRRMVNEYLNLK